MSDAPLLLAVECATRIASVALARGGHVLAVRSAPSDQHHGESLLAEIDALLGEARAPLSAVDAFAISVGPGAFTSLRIGLATVKGLAFGTERPIAPVSTLAAVAYPACPGGGAVAALLDARRGEVYAGLFDASGELPTPIAEEGVETAATLAARLPAGAALLGELPTGLVDDLRAHGREDVTPLPGSAPPARVLGVVALGAACLAAGQGVSAAALTAHYLRRPEAEEKRLAAAGALDTPEKLQ